MLVEFKVKDFKNFEKELIFSLDQIKNYEFSLEAIKNHTVKTSLVYGINGSGKSNLGLALFDITLNLTDKEKNYSNYENFLNLNSNLNAQFNYMFKFDSSFLEYKYEKDSADHMIREELIINGQREIYYDHINHSGTVSLKGTETLNTDLNEKNMSFVKYIRNNTVLIDNDINEIFNKFINFVDNMLLFSSLERNFYQGFRLGPEKIANLIIKSGKLKDFESFLRDVGIEYKLVEKTIEGQKLMFCDFEKNQVDFYSIASRGTISLTLFYCWLLELDKVSLVFIDEFDAFYHNKLARTVVGKVLESKAQAILTTHNTSIMDNDLLRPDCYFNLVNGSIKSFALSTSKELRKAHNVEKMYKAGSFNG